MKPLSTYRLQLNAAFTFAHAAELLPYFARLGVTHLYLSPIWTARPGSLHGYDVCDPETISPALGGEEGFVALSRAAAAHGIGILLDFVCNHMCADPTYNAAWRDMLGNGPSSPYAHYFDVDWHPVKRELDQKVLLPILGQQYGEVLQAGQLRIVLEDGEFALRYWDHNLPLNPRQCRLLLRHRLNVLKDAMNEDTETLQEYQSLIFQLDSLPAYTDISIEARENRLRERTIAANRFRALLERSPLIRAHIEENVREFNGEPGHPNTFDRLHELLEAQAYRLSYWRTAVHEINYRRFFDINELAGLRVESPGVFEATHATLIRLIEQGYAAGVRLDHIDGLYDPPAYLKRLREALGPDAYIVVEKILSEAEPLGADWAVDGATGYEFLNQLNRLYVQPLNMRQIVRTYRRFSHRMTVYPEISYASKQQIIAISMASELNVLAHELNRMSEQDRRCRDFTLDSLQEALREVVACFPVYRTYIGEGGPSERDRQVIDEAIRSAMARNPAMESSIFEFLRDCLCPRQDMASDVIPFARRLRFAMKFQQYTGPVQAKGLEDTAFYRYCPLLSLNEVGGDPRNLGSPLADFHAANTYRQQHLPRTMIATSTHDTKRGEDARARINVLSELASEWDAKLRQWSLMNANARTHIAGRFAPDRNDEYLFYQSLLSIWTPETAASGQLAERLRNYMAKAIKEAKTHSSWINPSNDYDAAVERFITNVLAGKRTQAFLAQFVPFAGRVARLGALNSLSQLALKITAPGVTDFYQGTELWDLTLVDPDNRAPVDFNLRREWLDGWDPDSPADLSGLMTQWQSGRIKEVVTAAGLRFRQRRPDLVIDATYQPLEVQGPLADHVVAFARTNGNGIAIAAGLRWMSTIVPTDLAFHQASAAWSETTLLLPQDSRHHAWRNVLTNEPINPQSAIPLSLLFRQIPGAVLCGEDPAMGRPYGKMVTQ